MSRHFKVHEVVEDRDELDQLESFAREPARTIDQVHEWLQAKGYTLSRGAVGNWMKAFVTEDKFRASNEVARALVDAAKKEGTAAISDAAGLQLSQMLFEQLVKLQMQEGVDTKELWAVSMALKNTVTAARHVEKLREEVAERQKKVLDEADKAAKTGASAGDVVATIKAALGIAA